MGKKPPRKTKAEMVSRPRRTAGQPRTNIGPAPPRERGTGQNQPPYNIPKARFSDEHGFPPFRPGRSGVRCPPQRQAPKPPVILPAVA